MEVILYLPTDQTEYIAENKNSLKMLFALTSSKRDL